MVSATAPFGMCTLPSNSMLPTVLMFRDESGSPLMLAPWPMRTPPTCVTSCWFAGMAFNVNDTGERWKAGSNPGEAKLRSDAPVGCELPFEFNNKVCVLKSKVEFAETVSELLLAAVPAVAAEAKGAPSAVKTKLREAKIGEQGRIQVQLRAGIRIADHHLRWQPRTAARANINAGRLEREGAATRSLHAECLHTQPRANLNDPVAVGIYRGRPDRDAAARTGNESAALLLLKPRTSVGAELHIVADGQRAAVAGLFAALCCRPKALRVLTALRSAPAHRWSRGR